MVVPSLEAAPVRLWLSLTPSQAESPTRGYYPRVCTLVFIVFKWGNGPYLSCGAWGNPDGSALSHGHIDSADASPASGLDVEGGSPCFLCSGLQGSQV